MGFWGFGGSCFKKDILNLVYLSEYFGLKEVAEFWEGVVQLNNWHQNRISQLVVKKLFGTVSGKKINILGFAFKSNTNDTRESSAIKICKNLLEEGAILYIHDPKVEEKQIENDLKITFNMKRNENLSPNLHNNEVEGSWKKVNNLSEAFLDSDAVLVLTEWEEYTKINWLDVASQMRFPAWIFDSRSIIDPIKVKEAGLNFWRIGDGT